MCLVFPIAYNFEALEPYLKGVAVEMFCVGLWLNFASALSPVLGAESFFIVRSL